MQSLGSASSEEPFWRRLDQSFKYPLNTYTLALIVGVSILNNIVMFVPFTILWQLMLTGAMMSYCFACLQQTAIGKFKAPDITTAYEGGLLLLVKLFAILLVMILFVVLTYSVLGPLIGNLTAVTAIVFIPSAIILFGLSNSLIEALNPIKQLRLITAVGLPYGLILAFVLVMTASVSIIHELIGFRFSIVSSMLQATVTNYYTVVLFHIMGYMIFQYQRELGFTARSDHGEGRTIRDAAENTKHLIDVLVKEADFNLTLQELQGGLKKYPDDPYFAKQCFEFILASRNTESIDNFGSFYLGYLIRHQEFHQLNAVYKRILLVKPDFHADTADVRHRLAQVLHQGGDSKTAVRILNHLHKEFPDYAQLPAAYELMAKCLAELPNMQKQAQQYRQFASKLRKRFKKEQPPERQPDVEHHEEPRSQPTDEKLKSAHSVVAQDVVDGLSLVPTDEEIQAEEDKQHEPAPTPDVVNQETTDGLSLVPIDK
jgi:tetratricopeptide (TPR) repeat protein